MRSLNLPIAILFSLLLISTVAVAETCPINDPAAAPGTYDFTGSPPLGWVFGRSSTYRDGSYRFEEAKWLSKTSIACIYSDFLMLVKFNVKPDSHWNRGTTSAVCESDYWSGYEVSAADCSFEPLSENI